MKTKLTQDVGKHSSAGLYCLFISVFHVQVRWHTVYNANWKKGVISKIFSCFFFRVYLVISLGSLFQFSSSFVNWIRSWLDWRLYLRLWVSWVVISAEAFMKHWKPSTLFCHLRLSIKVDRREVKRQPRKWCLFLLSVGCSEHE
jgi:hypothetical protein